MRSKNYMKAAKSNGLVALYGQAVMNTHFYGIDGNDYHVGL
jgi:hypothetical protein